MNVAWTATAGNTSAWLECEGSMRKVANPFWNDTLMKHKLGTKLELLRAHSLEKAKTKGYSERIEQLWTELEQDFRVVYQGYANDVRDTDNAWANTTVFHFEISEERGNEMLGDLLDAR